MVGSHTCQWSGPAPVDWLACRLCGAMTRMPTPLDGRERLFVIFELK